MRLLQSGKCPSGDLHGAHLVWKVSIWLEKTCAAVETLISVCPWGPLLWKVGHGSGPEDIQKSVFCKNTDVFRVGIFSS